MFHDRTELPGPPPLDLRAKPSGQFDEVEIVAFGREHRGEREAPFERSLVDVDHELLAIVG